MAELKDLGATPTGIKEQCDIQSQALTNVFTAIKESIVRVNNKTESELKQAIEDNKEEILKDIGLNKENLAAFKAIVDGFDGTEDGEFNTKELLLQAVGKSELNEQEIAKLLTCCDDVKEALAAEVEARKAQGVSLTQAVADAKKYASDLIQGFEQTINEVVQRVSTIENKINAMIDNMKAIGDCMQTTAMTLQNSVAMFDDLAPATNPNVA